MTKMLEGGCLCGAVRFTLKGKPDVVSCCHCSACQRRTGSAFGAGVYCREAEVEITGELRSYEHRSDETGRWLRFQFCPTCGTQVSWTFEARAGARALALGAFDDPKALPVERHGWTRSAHRWFRPGEGQQVFEQGALQPPK